MELQIKPAKKSNYPLQGILIKSNTVKEWIDEMQQMQLALNEVDVHPLPDNEANSIWGCLVVNKTGKQIANIGKNSFCQLIGDCLFIPERAVISPLLSGEEVRTLFREKYIFHPETGMVKLPGAVQWNELIRVKEERRIAVTIPGDAVFIPDKIKRFQVRPLSEDAALKQMEEKYFPEKKKFEDKPLSFFEKAKLAIYKSLINGAQKLGARAGVKNKRLAGDTGEGGFINKILNKLSNAARKLTERVEKDYEELEKRNQKHFDRLMDLLKKNPDEALKYAIPLDESGTTRGGDKYELSWLKRWSDFSLWGGDYRSRNTSGTAVLSGDSYSRLQQQYEEIAQDLIRHKEYHRASFVYMKLLKNNYKAAQVLEAGKLYAEAASVYLKYLNNKENAAACYKNGRMTDAAIKLYLELGKDEDAGDLYMSVNEKAKAYECYEKVANNHESVGRYIKAGVLYEEKMNNIDKAKDFYLKGWRNNREASSSLTKYWAAIKDDKLRNRAIEDIYREEVTTFNSPSFLQALKHEFNKAEEMQGFIKDIAYELVAREAATNKDLVGELRKFNDDKHLLKDTLLYKATYRKNIP